MSPKRKSEIGDGDQKNELLKESAALQLTDRVEFTGMLAENELIDLMRSLDIYVHASMGETMSTAIMQAMASGKPIVASDVPGIKNMRSPPKHWKRVTYGPGPCCAKWKLSIPLNISAAWFAFSNRWTNHPLHR